MLRISNFDDWTDYFYGWQKDIGLDAPEFKDYRFAAKYSELPVPEIEFGSYRGQPRWKTVMHIPDQRIRDMALSLIVTQGDTEFASVEQQRHLFETAPRRYDHLSLVARHNGRNAPRWADEPRADQPVRPLGANRGPEAARTAGQEANQERLNENSRELFHDEVKKLTDLLNKSTPEDQPKLKVPDLKFSRQIGQYAGQYFTIDGEPLTDEEWEKYWPSVMPSEENEKGLQSIFAEKGWVLPQRQEEFIPSEGARTRHPMRML